MCGICGYISPNSISEQKLWDMTNSMSHRGPDDSGVWTCEDNGYHVGFGHRRLSIFDLTQAGHQPMITSDGNIAVTYNGEIYNFKQLRSELECEGIRFNSNCDTEVLLQAYQKWGDDCVTRFNGMFAFAVYDKKKHKAIFARDRIGKKPLYYYHNGQTFIFGSELKALMKHPEFIKDINTDTVVEYLVKRCYYAPHTVFHNTYKLEPGCILVWDNGEIKTEKYWDLLKIHQKQTMSLITDENEAKNGLKERIQTGVRQRLEADVPVGIFLSGGIDSTVVAGTAARVSDKQVKSFTIGFHDDGYDEAKRAKRIAEHLGTQHTQLYITEEEILSVVSDIPQYYDEPFADSSQIPTMLVSRLARQDVTVALSGDGGDEVFCGYTRYEKKNLRKTLIGTVRDINRVLNSSELSQLQISGFMPKAIHALIHNRCRSAQMQVQETLYETIAAKMVIGAGSDNKTSIKDKIQGIDWQERGMLMEMLTRLPDQMLCKVDRASMRYALELRCPLLDFEVIEYSFCIPMGLKYRNGEKKWLLKQIANDYVPHELLEMPKSGFTGPLGKWLTGPLRVMVDKYTNKDILDRQGIFNPEVVRWLVDDLGHTGGKYKRFLWSLLMFQMWYQYYIEDLW